MNSKRQEEILGIILENEPIGISDIAAKMAEKISVATLNRELAALRNEGVILSEGKGPGVKYRVHFPGLLNALVDAERFFTTDTDERKIIKQFNTEIFDVLANARLFTVQELTALEESTTVYRKKVKRLGSAEYKKEFERLMIELSWKSSQIEGNTYNLLDTEQLLKYKIEAEGHTAEEALMLLNHKTAIEYTSEHPADYKQITLNKITDVHTLLTSEMGIAKNIRERIVRITGTKYTPPANQFIIKEALEKLCLLINTRENTFEKALLAILMVSYIQPFNDGNKRTARLTGNALLMADSRCPLSYRSVSPADYKRGMLLFYELNNITAFKKIFISQYQFAVENYF